MIDMGFQMTHEDLQAEVLGPGYDAAGFDIDDNEPDSDPSNDCYDTREQCWHGTAVLGVLDATTNNSTGLAGFENRPTVMPVKMADANRLTSQIIFADALLWVRGPHPTTPVGVVCITVNNTTLGSPAADYLLYLLYKYGKPIICSTGNSSSTLYPATSPYVLAVGMTDHNDNVLAAGVGPSLDVVAPAVTVWTLDLMGDDGLSRSANALCDNNPNYNCYMYGTSFSAPLVAGIAAKVLMRRPGLLGPPQAKDSAEVIYDVIRYSSSRTQYGASAYDTSRVNHTVGWGRVNASRALLSVAHGDANNDALITIGDAVFIINYIFADGPGPSPHLLMGDADGSGGLSIGDAVYVINHVFGGGPAPRISYYYSE
jgi:subtilisin family serine protease